MKRYRGWSGLCVAAIMAACNGPPGADGIDGTDGLDGTDGSNGTNGTDGAPGLLVPVIQSIDVLGAPAAPLGELSIHVEAQSAEGLTLAYAWSVSSPSWTVTSGDGTDTVVVTAPDLYDADTVLTVVVTDSDGNSATGRVSLSTVGNTRPIVHSVVATPSPSWRGQDVTLSVDASDVDGGVLGYTWELPPGFTIQSGQGTAAVVARADCFTAGTATVVVDDGDGGQTTAALFIGTWQGEWSDAELFELEDSGSAGQPEVDVSPAGSTIVVWEQNDGTNDNVRYAFKWPGSGWRLAANLDTLTTEARNPSAAIIDSGSWVAVWQQSDGTRNNIWGRTFAAATQTLSAAAPLDTEDLGHALYPRVAMAGNGEALVVWEQSNGTTSNIQSRRYDGSMWDAVAPLEASPGNAYNPQVAMNRDGSLVVVAWQQYGATYQDVWARRRVGGVWENAVQLDELALDDAYEPQVAMNEAGEILVAWEQEGAFQQVWARRFNGVAWDAPVRIDAAVGTYAYNPTVALNDSGEGMIVWQQDNGEGWSVRLVAGVFEPAVRFVVGSTYDPVVAIDPVGNATIVWEATRTNIETIMARRFMAGAGWEPVSEIDLLYYDAWNPMVALDAAGNATLVYQQTTAAGRWDVWWARFE